VNKINKWGEIMTDYFLQVFGSIKLEILENSGFMVLFVFSIFTYKLGRLLFNRYVKTVNPEKIMLELQEKISEVIK